MLLYLPVINALHSVTTYFSSPPCRKVTIFLEFGENLAVASRQIAPYEIKVILHISAECTGVVFLYLKKYIVRPKIIDAAGLFITELKLCDFPVTAPNPSFKCLKILVSNIQT